jgi:hypothetical protein
MELRTHRNGGKASLKSVADAWAKEDHNFPMSDSESDKQTVGFVQRIKASSDKAGPAIPNPLNIHQG